MLRVGTDEPRREFDITGNVGGEKKVRYNGKSQGTVTLLSTPLCSSKGPRKVFLTGWRKALEAGGVKGLVEPTMYYWGQ